MKNYTFSLIISSLLVCTTASASDYITQARIVDSQPIIETVYEEVEVCYYRKKSQRQISNNTGDRLLGGIAGAAAGSAFGKGSGRAAAAGIGALLGSELAAKDGELTGGELVGGVAGGLLGSQVGKGSGKVAATAIGTIIGSIVASEIENQNQTTSRNRSKKVKVCELQDKPKKVITGYTVDFEYNGVIFTDVLRRRPNGDYIDVNVNVNVVEDYTTTSIQ